MNESHSPDQEVEKPSVSSGTTHGYKIQARYNYSQPKVICGQPLDNRWRYIDFAQAPVGVPPGPGYQERELLATGCYGYTSAQALRWWFHAEADKHYEGICLETRLVKFEIKHSTEWRPVSTHGEIGGDDRSNCIPDWGKK